MDKLWEIQNNKFGKKEVNIIYIPESFYTNIQYNTGKREDNYKKIQENIMENFISNKIKQIQENTSNTEDILVPEKIIIGTQRDINPINDGGMDMEKREYVFFENIKNKSEHKEKEKNILPKDIKLFYTLHQDYSPEKLVNTIEKMNETERWRINDKYNEKLNDYFPNTKKHTLELISQFENNFSDSELPMNFDKNLFRIMLAIYDLEKLHGKREDNGIAHTLLKNL